MPKTAAETSGRLIGRLTQKVRMGLPSPPSTPAARAAGSAPPQLGEKKAQAGQSLLGQASVVASLTLIVFVFVGLIDVVLVGI